MPPFADISKSANPVIVRTAFTRYVEYIHGMDTAIPGYIARLDQKTAIEQEIMDKLYEIEKALTKGRHMHVIKLESLVYAQYLLLENLAKDMIVDFDMLTPVQKISFGDPIKSWLGALELASEYVMEYPKRLD